MNKYVLGVIAIVIIAGGSFWYLNKSSAPTASEGPQEIPFVDPENALHVSGAIIPIPNELNKSVTIEKREVIGMGTVWSGEYSPSTPNPGGVPTWVVTVYGDLGYGSGSYKPPVSLGTVNGVDYYMLFLDVRNNVEKGQVRQAHYAGLFSWHGSDPMRYHSVVKLPAAVAKTSISADRIISLYRSKNDASPVVTLTQDGTNLVIVN